MPPPMACVRRDGQPSPPRRSPGHVTNPLHGPPRSNATVPDRPLSPAHRVGRPIAGGMRIKSERRGVDLLVDAANRHGRRSRTEHPPAAMPATRQVKPRKRNGRGREPGRTSGRVTPYGSFLSGTMCEARCRESGRCDWREVPNPSRPLRTSGAARDSAGNVPASDGRGCGDAGVSRRQRQSGADRRVSRFERDRTRPALA